MSRRSAALLLAAALLLFADAAGQVLPWIHSNIYQIYAQNVTVAGATRGAFVWVPYFTPPPPPPGWTTVCYITRPANFTGAIGGNLGGALVYNSTMQRQYGLPPIYMSDAWGQYPSYSTSSLHDYVQLDVSTIDCSGFRYLQLVYNGTSLGGTVVPLYIPTAGLLVGASGVGPSPSLVTTSTVTQSLCGVPLTGFNILQPGTYYVKLPSFGSVHIYTGNCTMYILAIDYKTYSYWNTTYATWYNGTKRGIYFAVTFSAPCVVVPRILLGYGINNYYIYGSHAAFCNSTFSSMLSFKFYSYYALLARSNSTAWYRVNPHNTQAVIPVPVAVNMTTWAGSGFSFIGHSIYYYVTATEQASQHQPEVTYNKTLFGQVPGYLTPTDGGNLQGPSDYLDIFLVDPNNATNLGLAAFSTYFIPPGVGSAYVATDGGAAVFAFDGMLRPLIVYAPAGSNVLSVIRINNKTYFTETVACPYPLNTMPGQYYWPPGARPYINVASLGSYAAVELQNNSTSPIYVEVRYSALNMMMMAKINPGETAILYGPSSYELDIYTSLNSICTGFSYVWSGSMSTYTGSILRWTGSGVQVVGVMPSTSAQIANLTQQIANYLSNLTNALLSAYTKALTNLTAALKAAYSVPIPNAPTYVGAFSITTVQTALNALKGASAVAPPGALPSVALPPVPLVAAPAVSAAVAIAWAASRRDEDLAATAAVAGIALALFGVLMTLLYGAASLSLVALGVIIAAAAAAWRRSSG
jgi:hypothetical protein